MDQITNSGGSLPIQGEDDFDPYGSGLETKPEIENPKVVHDIVMQDSADLPELQLSGGNQALNTQISETGSSVAQEHISSPSKDDLDEAQDRGEHAEQVAPGITVMKSVSPSAAAKASVPREASISPPQSRGATVQPLPGIELAGNIHRTERSIDETDILDTSTSKLQQVVDAESALNGPNTTTKEDQSVNAEAEAEYDSSPYESSSEDTSSSDDSDDSDDDYELLDPVEQARRLMEGDASDDEGGRTNPGAQLRTANEIAEEIIEIPKIDGVAELQIEELGNIEAKVDNMILIKAKTSGEYQVLESGSILCLPDRTVIGVVSETLGRVQEPLYCVRFTNSATIAGFGLEQGTSIYYIPQHSTFVFTKALQAIKGSDASNIHDEEIGGDEIEFSDDEAEAEYKRKKKLEKQERKGLRGGSTRGRGDFSRNGTGSYAPSPLSTLPYDDASIDEGLYTPLTRPSNLNTPGQIPSPLDQPDGFSRGPGGMRGRGQRGRGRGGNRGRGDRTHQSNHRGSQDQHSPASGYASQGQPTHQSYSPPMNQYGTTPQHNTYPPSQQFQQAAPFAVQGAQYPQHFQQYQPNQFPGYQSSQQYAQQGFSQSPGQWSGYPQGMPGQASAFNPPVQWNQSAGNFPSIPNQNSAAQYFNHHHQQQQQQQKPPG